MIKGDILNRKSCDTRNCPLIIPDLNKKHKKKVVFTQVINIFSIFAAFFRSTCQLS